MAASPHLRHSSPLSKRKKIFYWRGFQLRFTALTACSLLVLLVFTSFHGLMMMQRVFPMGLIDAVWPELQSATVRLVLVGLLYVGVVTLAAAFLSHRLMGPLGRLEEEIKRVAESTGETSPIKLREGDDLEPVVDAINELVRKVKGIKQ